MYLYASAKPADSPPVWRKLKASPADFPTGQQPDAEVDAGVTASEPVPGSVPTEVGDPARTIRRKSWGRDGQYRREASATAWLCASVVLAWAIGFRTRRRAFRAGCVRRVLRSGLAGQPDDCGEDEIGSTRHPLAGTVQGSCFHQPDA